MIETFEYRGPMGREVPFEEIRRVQLSLLDALVKLCQEYHLRYYLSGGTLLGAVRHGGYIPWDDDIDVNMPRPDCEKLLQLTGGRINEHMEIGAFGGPVEHSCAFLRVYDTDYLLRQEDGNGKIRAYTNVSIDVFPIEGLPENKRRSDLFYFVAKCLVNLKLVAYYRETTGKWDWHRIIRAMTRLPAKALGWRRLNRMVIRHAKKYDYDKSAYVGVATCHVHTFTERLPRAVYGEGAPVTFEGRTLTGPADANAYLSAIYGDYRKLPPKEKQVCKHHNTVFCLKEGCQ